MALTGPFKQPRRTSYWRGLPLGLLKPPNGQKGANIARKRGEATTAFAYGQHQRKGDSYLHRDIYAPTIVQCTIASHIHPGAER
jgi:hypothetical protein